MGNGKKSKQIDFIVSTGNPNDASSQANKKRVRSVAALKSWPERRRKILDQLESSASGQSAFLIDEPLPKRRAAPPPPAPASRQPLSETAVRFLGPPRPPPPVPPKPRKLSPELFIPKTSSPTYLGIGAGSSIALYHEALSRVPPTPLAVAQVHTFHAGTPCHCGPCRHKRRLLGTPPGSVSSSDYVVPARRKRMADGTEKGGLFGGDMAMITPPSSPASSPARSQTDPFNCYPVPYQPWFDQILHHSTLYCSSD